MAPTQQLTTDWRENNNRYFVSGEYVITIAMVVICEFCLRHIDKNVRKMRHLLTFRKVKLADQD